MHRLIRHLILVLVAALFLQGCSVVRLGYGNGDSLARWWIDQYLDLAPEQDALARERLTRLHAWHRKTQLPDYARLLLEAKPMVAGRMTSSEAQQLTEAIISRVRTLTEQALPDVADLLVTLTPAQIERVAKRFGDKNADWAKEARLAEGETGQRKARFKRILERAEYWFGDFSDVQQAAIRRLVDAQPTGIQFWYEERQRRQRDWLDLVRKVQAEKLPRERVIVLLRNYVERFDLPSDPGRRATALAHRRAGAELTASIQAMTTPAQREHARLKFDDLVREIGEIAQEG
jgi:hypothetical protein